ncbi:MAG: hypothetical protein QMB98_05050 [Flaviflexus sp.]|uniref:hypothetical protein n=1 Tax=Flaviflexus sp. TaxID=1969482 RepID=UPI00352C1905
MSYVNDGYAYGAGEYRDGKLRKIEGVPVSEVDSIHPPMSAVGFGLTLVFRLIIAGMAGWSAFAMIQNAYNRTGTWEGAFDQAIFFTTFSVVIVSLAYGLGVLRVILPGSLRRKTEGSYGWFRGLGVLMSTMTGIIFALLLDGTYPDVRGLFAHLLVPILVALDWILVGKNQEKLHPAVPFLWVGLILPYLGVYWWDAVREGGGGPMYPFLDPNKDNFAMVIGGLLVGFLVAGYVLWLIGRLKAAVTGTKRVIPFHEATRMAPPPQQVQGNYPSAYGNQTPPDVHSYQGQ